MKYNTREYRIHQNERNINRRKKLAKEIGHNYPIKGKLRKHNMSCSCGMCDIQHPQKVHKAIHSIKHIEKLRIMKEQINENI